MKNDKASGPGIISIELMKDGPVILIEILAKTFSRCLLRGEDIPTD